MGREGPWLEGRVLQLQWGDGEDPSNSSWGQTHIWGLSMLGVIVTPLSFVNLSQIRPD